MPPPAQWRSAWSRIVTGRGWPLLLILLLQAALSARLIWANTAFTDEALYLWSGHMEWTHWLYGTQIPQFQNYFSGAPVVYPPLAALADSIGGLAAARALSLFFMLAATVLLHGTTRRIFNRTAATFAAGLFAGIGATEYLGSFATYDAMALFLLGFATWLGVIASSRRALGNISLLIFAALVLALANATKYASALFDPVVILTVVLMRWQRRRWWSGVASGLLVICVGSLAVAAALRIAGPGYWHGITWTTLARHSATSSPVGVVIVSMGWAGFVGGLGLVGAVVVLYKFRSWPYKLLGLTLAAAVCLAPAEQARIHTFVSLFKHVGFGEWFAAIVAGLALESLPRAVPKVKSDGAIRAALAAAAACAIIGALLAGNQFHSWPNSTKAMNVLRPLVAKKGSMLASDNEDVIEYYLPSEGIGSALNPLKDKVHWQSLSSSSVFYYLTRQGNLITGAAAFDNAIKNRYFSVIALSGFRSWTGRDDFIRSEMSKWGGYKLFAAIPYTAGGVRSTYQIWVRKGS